MSHVFHRHCHATLPTAVGGEGPYLIDQNGKSYLDGSCGAAVTSLGYGHPRVVMAVQSQVQEMSFAHTGFFTSEPAEQLAAFLASKAPGDLNKVYFTSGGSESVEAALKMARQYFLERGESKRHLYITRRQSYHGNTLGALGIGGNQWRREPFASLMTEAHYIDPCYAYRGQQDGETEFEYGQRMANQLEAKLQELGPENVAAFVAEPVVGATAGAVPAVPGYLKRIREICDQYGILLILDEVMCGMGRTGTLFACEQDDVVPDLITMAKGLGAGYQPIGAIMVQQKIFDTISDGSGFFQHGHTYMGHPVACAAALAVQHTIQDDNLLQNVRQMGNTLRNSLQQTFGDHENIGDIRGRGLFIGLELVADRETKQPLPAETAIHTMIKKEAMANGLMCYPMSGTINGREGHHILLAPPFIINEHHVDELVSKLKRSVDSAISQVCCTV